MTEQAGHLNAPDLVEECARALYEADDPWSEAFPWPDLYPSDNQSPENYKRLSLAVLSVLRKRGLLTIQALDMLADK